MIDFHSHVIPYIDDGAKDYDTSIAMLKQSLTEGVEHICATPHFIYGEAEIDREKYNEKLESLKQLIKVKNNDISILSGLEVYIHPELPKLYKQGRIWGINDTKYMLIELPMESFPVYTEEVFYELRLLGVIPILAHPERNLSILKNEKLLLNLINQGVIAQLTSGSLRGLYGKDIKDFSEHLVKRNMIHLLGSDAHNNLRRNTRIINEFDTVKDLNKELYHWMEAAQYKVIEGKEIEVLSVKESKNKFNFFSVFKK